MQRVSVSRALAGRLPRFGFALAIVCLLTACGSGPSAPSLAIFGSYFPGWIVCAVLGVIFAVIARQVLIIVDIDSYLPLPLLVYLAMAVAAAIGLWFLWFGGGPQ